jgi:hypothetical protein
VATHQNVLTLLQIYFVKNDFGKSQEMQQKHVGLWALAGCQSHIVEGPIHEFHENWTAALVTATVEPEIQVKSKYEYKGVAHY